MADANCDFFMLFLRAAFIVVNVIGHPVETGHNAAKALADVHNHLNLL
jgi:hypothetical protein